MDTLLTDPRLCLPTPTCALTRDLSDLNLIHHLQLKQGKITPDEAGATVGRIETAVSLEVGACGVPWG